MTKQTMILKRNHNKSTKTRSVGITKFNAQTSEQRLLMIAMGVSLFFHVIFFSLLVYAQTHKPKSRPRPAVMNVSLVSITEISTPSKSVSTAPAVTSKKSSKKSVTIKKKPAAKKVGAPKKIKKKVSLKKKTYKSDKIKKNTLKKLEKKVETTASDRIAKAIDEIKAKVGKDKDREITSKPPAETTSIQRPGGNNAATGAKRAEIIDIYRIEIAYQVQQNWAFPDQLAEGRSDMQTLLVFKVMPDGEIKDLFFTDRSGNSHFDESAYRAVMKTNPVDPHPKSVSEPFVQMGLRFTPEGIQ